MERWRLLLADGCLDAGGSLPRCLGYRTCEHDMAELPFSFLFFWASLVTGCAADPTFSCGLLYLSIGLLT